MPSIAALQREGWRYSGRYYGNTTGRERIDFVKGHPQNGNLKHKSVWVSEKIAKKYYPQHF